MCSGCVLDTMETQGSQLRTCSALLQVLRDPAVGDYERKARADAMLLMARTFQVSAQHVDLCQLAVPTELIFLGLALHSACAIYMALPTLPCTSCFDLHLNLACFLTMSTLIGVPLMNSGWPQCSSCSHSTRPPT